MKDNSLERKEILQKVSSGKLTSHEAAILIKKLYNKDIVKDIGEKAEAYKRDNEFLDNTLNEENQRETSFNHTHSSQNRFIDIAIIGVSGRFPDAPDVNKFWKNLRLGRNSIGEIPKKRWKWDEIVKINPKSRNLNLNSKWGGFLSDIDQFDPFFFNLSVREAEMMDPRQRLFIQEAWKCLEDAGYSDEDMAERECGIFVGCQEGDYVKGFKGEINPYISTGNSNSIMAARIAYFLNLRGPTMAIDTACSSTLVAIHLACQNISTGTCDMAIAGGVLVTSTPAMFMGLSKIGMFSSKGECRVFDNNADGTVMGEAVGAVVLKSLEAALRDGDNIYGIIKGSEINQDGKTNGITAPSASSQAALESKLYEKYNINPETIGYIEAHGTGTKLGDPIEIQALTDSFRRFTDRKRFCAIGSVKSNIGHSMPAAGISSLIKVLGCLKDKKLVPSLNYKRANEHINFEDSPFYVNTELKEWEVDGNSPRRAAISSFGFSGTNSHIVIEEAPPRKVVKIKVKKPYYFVPISAKARDALKVRLQDLYNWLEHQGNNQSIEDISYTLTVGRSHFPIRLAIVASSVEELRNIVKQVSEGKDTKQCFVTSKNIKNIKSDRYTRKNINILLKDLKKSGSLSNDDYKNKLLSLADIYVKGHKINLKELFEGKGYRRISLPTYPFAKERYWISHNNNALGDKNIDIERIHPLIEKNISTFDEQKFTNHLVGDEFYLEDHVINGFKILPGAAHIEMAFNAGNLAHKKRVKKIKNIVWMRPIVVEGRSKKIEISLEAKNGEADYEIYSLTEGNERLIYSQGKLLYGNNDPKENQGVINLETIKKRSKYKLDNSRCYKLFEQSGFSYGPSFRAIKELYVCDGEALSLIELPLEQKNELEKYVLHPGLLDSALQTIMGVRFSEKGKDEGPNMPFTLGEIEVLRPLTATCYAYLKESRVYNKQGAGLKKYDIKIADSKGRMLAIIKDFSIKPFNQEQKVKDHNNSSIEDKDSSSTLYCQSKWMNIEAAKVSKSDSIGEIGDILLFDNEELLRHKISQAVKSFRDKSSKVVLIKPGNGYRSVGDLTFEINPSNEEDYIKLIKDLREKKIELKNIIYAWSKGGLLEVEEAIKMQLNRSVYSLIFLSKQLMSLRPKTDVRLLYLHSCVSQDTHVNPIYSAVSGIAKTIRQENSRFIYKTVAIEGENWHDNKDIDINHIFLQEFNEKNEFEVNYIDNRRFVRRLKEVYKHDKTSNPVKLRQNGVYMITGGLGGLGLIFANYLAEKVKPRLVLVGRSEVDSRKKEKIRELKDMGAEIVYIKADISKKKEVDRVISNIKEKFGELNGVINCAGTNRDSYILKKTKEDIDNVIKPKVFGTLYLNKAVKNEDLDFFILFSSTAAVFGNSGQSAYSFANSFMDQLALGQSSNYSKLISINWPLWSDGGMQVNIEFKKMAERAAGIKPMETVKGIQALERTLDLGHSNMIVVEGNLDRLRQKLDLVEEDMRYKQEITRTDCHEDNRSIVDLLEGDLINLVSKFTKVSHSNIDPYGDIQDHGLDSVALTAFSNEINEKYNLGITPAIFFELDEPTINSLSQHLSKEYKSELCTYYDERFIKVHGNLSDDEKKDIPSNDILVYDNDILSMIEGDLIELASSFIKVSGYSIDVHDDIQNYGFDSVDLTAFSNEINDKYGLAITPAIFFELDEPTISSLAQYLFKEYVDTFTDFYSNDLDTEKLDDNEEVIEDSSTEIYRDSVENEIIKRNENSYNSLREPIAIIGMDVVMPGSDNVEEYWRNLEQKKDLITEIPKERWDWKALFGDMESAKWGGFMKEVDKFDAEFFKMSPREAKMTDPQQRMLLERVWKTFEDAGYNPVDFAGRKIGVFVGISSSDYYEIMMKSSAQPDVHSSIGNSSSIRANRVSYIFDFRGPSEAIDTACSSSLVAIHRGVEAIRSGTCEIAVAGGVNVIVSPTLFRVFNSAGMLSENGRCKTFDKSANGYVRGEGVGAVLLKPLTKAIEDGDHIYGVIKGTNENHGGRAKSITAPNANAQAELIIDAYERAGVSPDSVSYIETHGTGTSLGDPVEVNGLKKAFKELYKRSGIPMTKESKCGLSSVKTNIGHLEAAAGIAGITKILLALKHKKIPGTVHFKEINPYIDIDESPFYIVDKTKEWQAIIDGDGRHIPRIAGVSSFGYGGSNAHIILEEYIDHRRMSRDTSGASNVILLSAKDEEVLRNYAGKMANHLKYYCKDHKKDKHSDEEFSKGLIGLVSEILNVKSSHVDRDVDLREYGLDQVGMTILREKIKEKWDKDLTLDIFSQSTSINELASFLDQSIYSLDSYPSISLEEIAYTLQVGRDPMKERLVIVVSSINELVEKLEDFVNGKKDIEKLFRGTVEIKSRKSESGKDYNHKTIESINPNEIAKMFVSGIKIDWNSIYGYRKPNRISLPTYPFKRDRYWFNDVSIDNSRERAINIKEQKKSIEHNAYGENHLRDGEALMDKQDLLVVPRRKLVLKRTSDNSEDLRSCESVNHNEYKDDIKSKSDIVSSLKKMIAKVLYMDISRINERRSFKDLGLDSILCVEFAKEIREEFKVDIKATKLYDYSTINRLSEYLLASNVNGISEFESKVDRGTLQTKEYTQPTNKGEVDIYSSLVESLKKMLADVLYMNPSKVNPKKSFKDLGLDSILCVEFAKQIREDFQVDIKATRLYDYSTIDELAKYLKSIGISGQKMTLDMEVENDYSNNIYVETDTTKSVAQNNPSSKIVKEDNFIEARKIDDLQDIAVIGISSRLPGAENTDEFWDNLKNGVDSISEVPIERWDVDKYYHPDISSSDKCYSKWGGFLKDIDKFDPLFFNISPAEAEFLDPQQRLFMQEAWKALEDAGYSAQKLNNTKCGVYVGVMTGSEYEQNMFNAHSILSARIPYFLNLKGPAFPIDTACSSSMVAVHLACKSLLNREADMMLAGGVTLYLTVKPYQGMCKSGMLSKEGKCKTFDNSADGFVPAEGVGVLVLKRLDKAVEDGDYIYGIIKGSGINQDGRTNGITAPSSQSQTELELEVYESTGINPETISYVECHGTGTKLGDPIEIDALTDSFRKYTDKKRFCPIGSVKTNIGHTSAASGVVGIIKVLLSLKNKMIPPSLNFEKENEHINFADSPFYVNIQLAEWKKPEFGPRRAAVSSFGFSGTNVHMIIEEASKVNQQLPKISKPAYLIPLSAKNKDVLKNKYRDLLKWIEAKDDSQDIQDIAFTLAHGRTHFKYRSAIIARDLYELKNKLNIICKGHMCEDILTGKTTKEAEQWEGQFIKDVKEIIKEASKADILQYDVYKNKLLTLADLYVKGYDIDWKSMYKQSNYCRIPMPTYPFLKRRCWIEKNIKAVAREDNEVAREDANPLIGVDKSTESKRIFEIELKGDEFFLRDNVVYEQKVLPGVAYLEIARAAGEVIKDKKVKKIENLIWSNLITVSNKPRKVSVTFKTIRDNTLDFIIGSKGEDDRYIVNAQGKIIYENDEANSSSKEFIDIEGIKARCPNILRGKDCYEAYSKRKFDIGPSLQCMKKLYYREGEALTELELPPTIGPTFNNFVLHPSLMDGVLQTVTGLMINTIAEIGRPYLSFALGETEIIEPLSEKCYVHAKFSDKHAEDSTMKKFDMVVVNQEGRPLIKIKDFILKKAIESPKEEQRLSNKLKEEKQKVKVEIDNEKEKLYKVLKNDVVDIVSNILKIEKDDIDFKTGLLEYGFTSITIIKFINQINDEFKIEASVEGFFDVQDPTIDSLTDRIFESFREKIVQRYIQNKNFYNTVVIQEASATVDIEQLVNASDTQDEFSFIIGISRETRDELKEYVTRIVDYINNPQKEKLDGDQFTNIWDIYSRIQKDIYKLASENLKTTNNGYDESSIEIFSNEINRKFNIKNSKKLLFKSPSLGAFIKYSCSDFRENLMKHYNGQKDDKDFDKTIELKDIAYTLHTERTEMKERLALVASSIDDLVEKLTAYCRDDSNSKEIYVGNSEEDNSRYLSMFEDEEGKRFIKEMIENRRFDRLAQIWVMGGKIDWSILYEHKKQNIIYLPK